MRPNSSAASNAKVEFPRRSQPVIATSRAKSSPGRTSKEALEVLRAGRARRDPRLRALSDLSRTMVRNRGKVSEQDLEAFYAAGFSKAQALEVVLGAGFSVMANSSGHLVHAPLGAALEPYAWSKPLTRGGDREAATSPSAPAATR